MNKTATETLTRFDLSQRLQHILLITSFSMLGLTGLPQSFARASWAQAWMGLFGGIEGIRKVHHLFATIMAFVFFYHVIVTMAELLNKKNRGKKRTMLPGKKDIQDAWQSVKYLLGKSPEPPKYDRFDFKQKVEYWALIWGTVLMGATGLVLMFPELITQLFAGEIVYAAKAAHGLEALLAVASIVTWHMYNTHLQAGMFPLDTTIFTGKISLDRMQEEHPLEYARMMAPPPVVEEVEPVKVKKERKVKFPSGDKNNRLRKAKK